MQPNTLITTGQWFGKVTDKAGSTIGFAIVNFDGDSPNFGRVLFNQTDIQAYGYIADIEISKLSSTEVVANLVNIRAFDFEGMFQNHITDLPSNVSTIGAIKNGAWTGVWNFGTVSGSFEWLEQSYQIKEEQADQTLSWHSYKGWATETYRNIKGVIFRGHSNSKYPLMSSLHRRGRLDLVRYVESDIPELAMSVEGVSGNLLKYHNDPHTLGTLLNLGQHHGFPTPLLDWTDSPFVAAFFAFRHQQFQSPPTHVRIFAVSPQFFEPPFRRGRTALCTPRLFVDHVKLPTPGNPRAIAQQASLTCSNLFALESFMRQQSSRSGENYLTTIDIPFSERREALTDLSMMGITAASLFPGMDGMCEALAAKQFGF